MMSLACDNVLIALRLSAYIGWSGSMPSFTPALAAWGMIAAIPSVICRRASASGMPGTAPQTSTTSGAQMAAASSIARRLSSKAFCRSDSLIAGKNPVRQRLTTFSPESVRMRADSFIPSGLSDSRHTVIPAAPRSRYAFAAAGSASGFVVMVVMHKRERGAVAITHQTSAEVVSAQRRNIDPAPLLPGFDRQFRQLHALGRLAEGPLERLIERNMAQKIFPLHFERVVVIFTGWHVRPIRQKIDRAVDIGIPHRSRGPLRRLYSTLSQPGDR